MEILTGKVMRKILAFYASLYPSSTYTGSFEFSSMSLSIILFEDLISTKITSHSQ